MDERIKNKIYDEMYMWMTAKNDNNQYINGQLTRRLMRETLQSTFSFNLVIYKEYIHQVWKTIKKEIHEGIEEEKLSENFSNFSINEDDKELNTLFKKNLSL